MSIHAQAHSVHTHTRNIMCQKEMCPAYSYTPHAHMYKSACHLTCWHRPDAAGDCTNQVTSCKAACYSVNERHPPPKCSRKNRCACLSEEKFEGCLKKWANCVKKAFRSQHGKVYVYIGIRQSYLMSQYHSKCTANNTIIYMLNIYCLYICAVICWQHHLKNAVIGIQTRYWLCDSKIT